MRTFALLLALLPFANGSHAQSCVGSAGEQMYLQRPDCDLANPCFPGRSLPFRLVKRTACYPPYAPCPGYTLQACDTVSWSFGDGETATVAGGDPNVTHTYAKSGLYSVEARITNPNGSGYAHEGLIVAVEPLSVIGFVDPTYTVAETAGSVTVKLKRTRDTSRRVKIDYRTGYPANGSSYLNLATVEGSVTFEPGETTKSITIPVLDDSIYNGDSWHYVWIECYTGEALLDPEVFMGTTQVHIVEDDRAPTASVARNVRVVEGDEGMTLLKIPVTLSQTFTEDMQFWWTLRDGSARSGTDWQSPEMFPFGAIIIPAGSTRGEFSVKILGDLTPEADETFSLEFFRSGGPPLVVDGSPVTIAIANDDIAFSPADITFPAGQRQSLMISGTIAGVPNARLESTDPAIVDVPASVSLSGASASFDVQTGRAGTANVRATIDGTSKSTTARVTVYEPFIPWFDPTSVEVRDQHSIDVTVHVDPSPAEPLRVVLTTVQPSLIRIPSSVTVPVSGKVSFTIDGRAPGRGSVVATLPDAVGQPHATLSVTVLEAVAPSVAWIEPATGPTAGGTRVTIHGENFRADCTLKFGDLFATITAADASAIVATTPPHAQGPVDVSVQCGTRVSSLSNGFQYTAPPKYRAVRK